MALQFKNMNDLVEYLAVLEARVNTLENENRQLQAVSPPQATVDGNVISKSIARALPRSNVVSPSFWKRAFAIWGHFFVANLIITIIMGSAYACLMMVMFGSLLGNLAQSQK
ncbi:MAG: hypothetical protein JNM55_13925 [Anaerolineales bacterium]|nr:hypothetical protein [Anaerolineales bacterium]